MRTARRNGRVTGRHDGNRRAGRPRLQRSVTLGILATFGGGLAAAALSLLTPTAASASGAPTALILSTTVTVDSTANPGGGQPSCSNMSLEQCNLVDAGWSVTVVSPSTWDSMSAAQFGSYQLLVMGDTGCGSVSQLSAAVSDESTWAPTLTGSVLIIGTDPVFHYGNGGAIAGAGKLVQHGLNYAGAQTGKTGLYLDLSCYYAGGGANQSAPILDGLEAGFHVNSSPGCADAIHITGSAAQLLGLTDADLSSWSCSTHEEFGSWPADFVPYATDTSATPPNFTAPDGTSGVPYIVGRGGGLSTGEVGLAGPGSQVATGTNATLTASVQLNGTGVSGATVTLTCSSGPCSAGSTATVTTDSGGTATFTYSSPTVGTDVWTASYQPPSGPLETSAAADVVWFTPVVSTTTTTAVVDAGTGGAWDGTEVTGASAYDTAVVTGSSPTGTVTYSFFTNGTCSAGSSSTSTVTLSGGSVPASSTVGPLGTGSYSFDAAYSGDSGNLASTSACEPFSVAQAPTTFTASANPTSTTYGNTVQLSATGLPSDATGTVTFTNDADSSTLCTATVSSGSASCTTAALPPGSYSVTATYSGDSNYLGSTASTSFTINQAPTSFTASANPTSATFGQTVQLSESGLPSDATGTVTYTDTNDSSTLCTATVSAGSATCTTAVLPPGSYPVLATYSGDSNYLGSSASTSFTDHATTTTALTVVPVPSTFGQSVTLTATITQQSGTPPPAAGGTVDFQLDGVDIAGCTAQTVTGDVATCVTAAFPAGSHSVVAVYSGDTNFFGSTSPGDFTGVNQAATTVTVTTNPVGPVVFGQPVTITAVVAVVAPGTGNPPGWVTFSNGSTPLCSNVLLSIVGGQWEAQCTTSALPVGTAALIASYSNSDGNYKQSSNGASPYSLVVNPAATTTSLVSSANPSVTGQSVTFTASVSSNSPGSGTPTGTVTFKVNGVAVCSAVVLDGSAQATCTVANLVHPGSPYSVTAFYSGATDFASSDDHLSPLSQVVNADPTATTVSSSVNPSVTGQPVTFTATVTSNSPGSGTPTGSVTFKVNGSVVCTAVALNGSGQATCTVSNLVHAGSPYSVTAFYTGPGDYSSSDNTGSPLSQVVGAGSTSTTLTSLPNPSTYGQSVTFTATVTAVGPGVGTPSGTVTFTADGGTVLCASVPMVSGVATCSLNTLIAGTHTVVATYNASGDFGGSTSPILLQGVNQSYTTTTVVADVNPQSAHTTVTFTVTVAPVTPGGLIPTGTVNVSDGTVYLCINVPLNGSGQGICVLPAGFVPANHTIVGSYNGDGNYRQSSGSMVEVIGPTSTAVSMTTSPADYGEPLTFTFQVSSPVGPVPSGTVTITSSQTGATVVCSTSTLTQIGPHTVQGTCTDMGVVITPGAVTFTASYSGDVNYQPSSNTTSGTVVQEPTSTAVSVTTSPVRYGEPIVFQVTVTAGDTSYFGETPGPVTVSDGTHTVCTVSTWVEGPTGTYVGSCTDSTFLEPVGNSTTFTASFAGDTKLGASSGTATPTIVKEPTSLTVSVTTGSPTYGQPLAFQVVLTAGDSSYFGETPGSVTVSDVGSVTVCTVSSWVESPTGVYTGSCTDTTVADAAGSETFTAAFAGDGNLVGSSNTVTTSLAKEATSTAVTVTTGSPIYGQPLAFRVVLTMANPSTYFGEIPGSVSVKDAGSTTVCTVSSWVESPNGVYTGSCTDTTVADAGGSETYTAGFAGDSNLVGSSHTVTTTLAEDSTSQVLTVTTATPIYGEPFTVQDVLTVGLPGTYFGEIPGAVTVTDGSSNTVCTISSWVQSPTGVFTGSCTDTDQAEPAGTDSLTATLPDDGNLSGSTSAAATLTVGQRSTSLTVSVTTGSPTYGQPLAFQVVLTAGDSSYFGETPGSVIVTDAGSTTVCTVSSWVEGPTGVYTGSCTDTTVADAAGSETYTAAFAGDSNLGSSSNTVTTSLATEPTSLVVTVTTGSPTYGQPLAFQVVLTMANPSTYFGGTPGSVTVSDSGSTTVCTVSSWTESPTGVYTGSCTDTTVADPAGPETYTARFGGTLAPRGPRPSDLGVSSNTVTTSLAEDSTSQALSVTGSPVYGEPFTVQDVLTVGSPGTYFGETPGAVTVTDGSSNTVCTISSWVQSPTGVFTGSCTDTGQLEPEGTGSLTATLADDGNLSASSPPPATLTMSQEDTSLTVSVTTGTPTYGQPLAFQVVLTAGDSSYFGETPGSVTVKNAGSTTVCTVSSWVEGRTGVFTGSCTDTTVADAAGSETYTASFAGDLNLDSSSNTVTTTLAKEATSTAVTVTTGSPTYGQPLAFQVVLTMANPSTYFGETPGSVTVKDAGSTTVCTVSSWVESPNGVYTGSCTDTTVADAAGSETYTASFAGDADLLGSSHTVTTSLAAEGTTVSVTAGALTYGHPQVFTVTLTMANPGTYFGANPTNTVTVTSSSTGGSVLCTTSAFTPAGSGVYTATCTDNNAVLVPAGGVTFTATVAGTGTWTGSSGTDTTSVAKSGSTTTVTSSTNPSVVGQAVTFTATVGPTGAGAPSGTVTFTLTVGLSTVTICSNVAVNGSGQATCVQSAGAVQTGTVTATYSGDPNFTGSVGTKVQTVSQAATTTTVASGTNPLVAGQSVTLTATVTVNGPGSANPTVPTGTVRFAIGSTVLCAAAPVSGGHATCTAELNTIGTGTVTVTYSGDGNFTGSAGTVAQNVVSGYWLVASDGGIFAFGASQFYGSTAGTTLNSPMVGMAATPDGKGYWLVASDGGIFAYGDAVFYGSMGSQKLNKPVVGMVTTADGKGYWLVASDGGVFNFGDAGFYGSAGSLRLNKGIVALVATPDGKGYFLVASDGGVFAYGDAVFSGNDLGLPAPVVALAITPDNHGYWLIGSDGSATAFGDAVNHGSMAGQHLNKPIVSAVATPDGGGYWMVASDGGIFAFGDAIFYGSEGGQVLNKPIVGIARL